MPVVGVGRFGDQIVVLHIGKMNIMLNAHANWGQRLVDSSSGTSRIVDVLVLLKESNPREVSEAERSERPSRVP